MSGPRGPAAPVSEVAGSLHPRWGAGTLTLSANPRAWRLAREAAGVRLGGGRGGRRGPDRSVRGRLRRQGQRTGHVPGAGPHGDACRPRRRRRRLSARSPAPLATPTATPAAPSATSPAGRRGAARGRHRGRQGRAARVRAAGPGDLRAEWRARGRGGRGGRRCGRVRQLLRRARGRPAGEGGQGHRLPARLASPRASRPPCWRRSSAATSWAGTTRYTRTGAVRALGPLGERPRHHP